MEISKPAGGLVRVGPVNLSQYMSHRPYIGDPCFGV